MIRLNTCSFYNQAAESGFYTQIVRSVQVLLVAQQLMPLVNAHFQQCDNQNILMLNNETRTIKFCNGDECSQELTDNLDLRVVANEFCSKNEHKRS